MISTWSSSGSSSRTSASRSSSRAAATSARRFGERWCRAFATSVGRSRSNVATRLSAPWPCSSSEKPLTADHSTVRVSPLRRSAPPRPLRTKYLSISQSRRAGELLDGHVQDGDLLAFLAMAVHQPHPPVQELTEDETFGGPLFEAPHVDDAGGDDLAGLDARHPGHRQEDPPTADHLDHQAQDARRSSADPQHRHQITDPADLVPVRVENGYAGQVRDEDPGVTAAILGLLRPSVSTVSVRSA